MKQRNLKKICLTLCLLCLTALLALPAQAVLKIKITEGSSYAIPVAIPPFVGPVEIPLDVAEVASDDLRSTGLFDVLPRSKMPQRPRTPKAVDFEQWRAADTDNLVVGTIQPDDNGGYRLRFDILNTSSGSSIATYKVRAGNSQLRSAAHAVANLVYRELTGEDGYFLSRIAYITVTGEGAERRYRLMVADYDGYNATSIYSSLDPVMSPAWSPDGSRIAYVAFDLNSGKATLRVQNVATGESRIISKEPGINGAPSWSPDGRYLAMTLSHKGDPDIYTYDLQTGERRQITTSPAIDTEPVWAPDGHSIYFTSGRGGQPQIYRMDPEGSNIERVTFTGRSSQDAAISPD